CDRAVESEPDLPCVQNVGRSFPDKRRRNPSRRSALHVRFCAGASAVFGISLAHRQMVLLHRRLLRGAAWSRALLCRAPSFRRGAVPSRNRAECAPLFLPGKGPAARLAIYRIRETAGAELALTSVQEKAIGNR